MIYLAIGSNLASSYGNRLTNINLAISYLKENKIKIVKKSSFYETLSYPDKKKPKFINIVIAVKSNLSARDLMSTLLSIEEKLERKRLKKNDPRTCDIDIIDFDRKIINLNFNNLNLNNPHQSMTSRNFVLFPLQEICPDWTHPITNVKIDALIKDLKLPNYDITKISQNDISNYVK